MTIGPAQLALEKTVLSLLMWSLLRRGELLDQYPGLSASPESLFGHPTAQKILPLVLAARGRYTSAALQADMPHLTGDPDFDPVGLYGYANLGDEAKFADYVERLRLYQKHSRVQAVLKAHLGQMGKHQPDQADQDTQAVMDALLAVSTVGAVQLDPAIHKVVERVEQDLLAGKHQQTLTGIRKLDDLIGGIHLQPGELIVIGGQAKARKTTTARGIVANLLRKGAVRVVWVTNEPSFSPGDLSLSFIAQEAARVHYERRGPPLPLYSRDSVAAAIRSDPQLTQAKNWAVAEAREIVLGWRDNLRIYGTGIREGNSLNLAAIVDRVRLDIELRGYNLVIVDNLQEWLATVRTKHMSAHETMGHIISVWSKLHSQYHIAMILISQYSRGGDLLYGGMAEYATNLWLECRLKVTGGQEDPRTVVWTVKRGRWIGSGSTEVTIDPASGLILE